MPEPTWKIEHGPKEELPWWEDHAKIKLAASLVVIMSVCGIIWYAYFSDNNIQKNESHGNTTVINASQEPVRARPTEPGGQQVPHQNATVYERLNVDTLPTATPEPLPLPEKPIVKPEAPTAQPVSSPTVLSPLPLPQEKPTTGAPVTAPLGTQPTVPATIPAPVTSPEQPMTRLPLSAHTELAQAQSVQTPAPQTQPTEPVKATETLLAAPVAPETAAPKPAPAQEKPAIKLADAPPVPLAEPKKTDVKTQPSIKSVDAMGGFRIQLAALASKDKAESAWSSATKKHPFLSSLSLFVDKVDRNGTLFYRVQAGPFKSKQEASDMCEKLKNNNAACMVVKP